MPFGVCTSIIIAVSLFSGVAHNPAHNIHPCHRSYLYWCKGAVSVREYRVCPFECDWTLSFVTASESRRTCSRYSTHNIHTLVGHSAQIIRIPKAMLS